MTKILCDSYQHRKNCMRRMVEHELCKGWELAVTISERTHGRESERGNSGSY